MNGLDFYSSGACVAVDQSNLLILQPHGQYKVWIPQQIARDGCQGKDYRRGEKIPVPLAL